MVFGRVLYEHKCPGPNIPALIRGTWHVVKSSTVTNKRTTSEKNEKNECMHGKQVLTRIPHDPPHHLTGCAGAAFKCL